jgi:ACS family tartrate transporter-like MFS transporter
LFLQRLGARRWIATIMVTWGVISSAMVFVSGPRSFYALRFLLGAAEAGFFPGVIFYLKSWFPAQARARTVARFMTAAPLSGVLGGPLSGALLELHGKTGLAGWQWMFLMEGIPAVLLGLVAFQIFGRSAGAGDMASTQRARLAARHAGERAPGELAVAGAGVFSAIRNGQVWMLAMVYFGINTVSYGISLWLPKLIHSLSGVGELTIGMLSAIPYVAAAIAMVVVGLHSDHSGERRWHTALPAFAGAIALVAAAYSTSVGPSILAISVAVLAVFSVTGSFWAMPAAILSDTAAAAGIAFINSMGNLGGFVGPYVIGVVRTSTGQFKGGLLLVGAALAMSGVIVLGVRLRPTP